MEPNHAFLADAVSHIEVETAVSPFVVSLRVTTLRVLQRGLQSFSVLHVPLFPFFLFSILFVSIHYAFSSNLVKEQCRQNYELLATKRRPITDC